MTRNRIGVLLSIGALGIASANLQAQVREQQLEQPNATFPEAFSLIQSVRELADGRVMVADPLGQALVVADLGTGRADTLGGVGQGPAEYRQPDGLFALPGDSTLLVDLGNARLTVVGPDGGFAETMPITQGEPGPGGNLLIILPRGIDAEGRIYFQPFGARGPQLPDSAEIVRWDRASGAMDTVVKVGLPKMKSATSGGAGNRSVMIRPIPLSPEDAWAVAPDGRIATARAIDYHVEWAHPTGKVVKGPAIEYKPVKIRQADKEEWAEGLSNGLRVGMMIDNGERRISLGRGGGGGDGPDLDSFEWPDAKPAFASNGVRVTPEGDMWVQRHVTAGTPVQFDVFDGAGNLKGRVLLPAGREIVGFGSGVVYAVRTDDLGLQWLERYTRSST